MKNVAFMIILVFGLASCASREDIIQNYEEKVDYSDGISLEDAKHIAKRKIIGVPEKCNYKITAPSILNNIYTQKYPDFWFVVFGHNWLSPISTDASAKTYSELRDAGYLVVINRINGAIPFSGEYFPHRSHGFDWVFREHRTWEERVNPPAKSSQAAD